MSTAPKKNQHDTHTNFATSQQAIQALTMVRGLQQRFVAKLEIIAPEQEAVFAAIDWQRDGGIHGGGVRFSAADTRCFGRASVNVSQVHYDDKPNKTLGSATAISTIIHPQHPLAPSVHIHISWTEMKTGQGYWRMMADLNPAIEDPSATAVFTASLAQACPDEDLFKHGLAMGDRYFTIPALQRHRGVSHFYLEQYQTKDKNNDFALAQRIGEAAIDGYMRVFRDCFHHAKTATVEQQVLQSHYHTLYFFQVLTLDRGTTTGLLIHKQNDVGILGSLPACIDRELLQSWLPRLVAPQDRLLQCILSVLPKQRYCTVDDRIKRTLAEVVRQHYQRYPEALSMQASGDLQPPTVENHRAGA